MKYIVMECHPAYSVLMGEDASFVKAANMHYSVGQTVEAPILMDTSGSKSAIRMTRSAKKWVMTAAACLLMFFGFGVYYCDNNFMAYAYIIISSDDAEVKIEMNKKGEVISVIPLSELGERTVDGYKPEKTESESDVADDILKRYVKLGYIEKGETVSFLIEAHEPQMYNEFSDKLHKIADGQPDAPFKADVRRFDNRKEIPANSSKIDEQTHKTQSGRQDAPSVTAPKSSEDSRIQRHDSSSGQRGDAPQQTVRPDDRRNGFNNNGSERGGWTEGYSRDKSSGNSTITSPSERQNNETGRTEPAGRNENKPNESRGNNGQGQSRKPESGNNVNDQSRNRRDEPDNDRPDEREPDENEPDDNEPDENEPDENERDENGRSGNDRPNNGRYNGRGQFPSPRDDMDSFLDDDPFDDFNDLHFSYNDMKDDEEDYFPPSGDILKDEFDGPCDDT